MRPQAALALAARLTEEVFPPDVVARLDRVVDLGSNVVLGPGMVDRSRLVGVEILVTSWGCPPLDQKLVGSATRLRAIVHAGGSVKRLVPAAAFERGIAVSSAAAANAVPVAEYTVAMLVLAAKRAFEQSRAYASGLLKLDAVAGGDWGIAGCTVGVVGASRVGRLVLRRLADLDVHVLVADPYLNAGAAAELGAELVDLDELCRRSDLVTVHAPALPETRGMFGGRRLALLRDGAAIINTSRGSLVDTAALTAECLRGRLTAVLDVTDPEPLPADHPLHHLPNVLVTPHLAGARGRELRRVGMYAAAEVERFVRGEPLHGAVTRDELERLA